MISPGRILYYGLLASVVTFCVPALAQPAPSASSPSTEMAAALALYDKPDREQRLLQGARLEGEVSVYTSLTADVIAALVSGFEKKYAIKVKAWRASSEKIVQRALTETRAGNSWQYFWTSHQSLGASSKSPAQ